MKITNAARSRWAGMLLFTGLMLAGCQLMAATVRRGLMVGIDHYDPTYINSPLNSCTNDAIGMKWSVLSDAGRWSPGNVSVLIDAQATKTAIRTAISQMAAAAVSGDLVVYFHSSHGGRHSGYDAYVATYNANYEDYELAADLATFQSGVTVIIIVDSCYSGGMFKELVPGVNDWDFAGNVMRKLDALQQAAGLEKAVSIGWLTASDYDELSWAGDPYSLFAGYVIEGFYNADANVNGDVTFLELYDYAAPLTLAENPSQTAQAMNTSLLSATIAAATRTHTAAFTMTGTPKLNGAVQSSIALPAGSNLSGGFAYRAENGAVSNANMIAVVGLVNGANLWDGGEPLVVYSGVPSQSGSTGKAAWTNLTVPAALGACSLRYKAYQSANTAQCISDFKTSPPVSNSAAMEGLVATVTVEASEPSFHKTGSPTLNGQVRDGIAMPGGGNLSGSFPYLAKNGQDTNVAMVTVVGLVNSANQWTGGIPQVVYSGVPSLAGDAGTAVWTDLSVPASAPCLKLRFKAYSATSEGQCISNFQTNPPTADSGAMEGVVATVGDLWAAATDAGSGWSWLSWFGYFAQHGNGWIFHAERGWTYCVGSSTVNLWLWSTSPTWMWSSDATYPFLWSHSLQSWVWYYTGTGHGTGGWYYNFATGSAVWL